MGLRVIRPDGTTIEVPQHIEAAGGAAIDAYLVTMPATPARALTNEPNIPEIARDGDGGRD